MSRHISVVAVESHPYSAGDTITMRLMKRAKVWLEGMEGTTQKHLTIDILIHYTTCVVV